MASSLVLGSFDLLNPSSSVLMSDSWDRGAPSPTVSEIVSTVLDGAAVTGRAAGNRNIVIPILVNAPDRVTAATLANQVLQFVDQATWPLTWTPDGGLPVVFDCYRASVVVTSDLIQDAQGWQAFTITAQALPYGRSPNPVTVALSGTPLLVDGFNSTAPTATKLSTGGSLAASIVTSGTTAPYESTGSLKLSSVNQSNGYSGGGADSSGFGTFSLTRTGLSIAVSAAMSTGHLMFKSGTTGRAAYVSNPAYGLWTGTITTSSSGSFPIVVAGPSDTYDGVWLPLRVTIPYGPAIPAGATITGWSITSKALAIYNSYYDTQPSTYVIYFDDLRLFPVAAASVSNTNGGVYLLNNVLGSARTPISLNIQRSGLVAWVAHIPPADQPLDQPLMPLTSKTYTTPTAVRYNGTYSVYVGTTVTTSVGTARTITATFGQSLPSGYTKALTGTSPGYSQNLVYLGEIALPLVDFPTDSLVTTTVTMTSSQATDDFPEVLLLDTRGQTVICFNAPPASNAWIDAPDPTVGFGGVWAGSSRAAATSVSSYLTAASTLLVNPGATQVLLYAPDGTPTGTVTYYPRWLQEATS